VLFIGTKYVNVQSSLEEFAVGIASYTQTSFLTGLDISVEGQPTVKSGRTNQEGGRLLHYPIQTPINNIINVDREK